MKRVMTILILIVIAIMLISHVGADPIEKVIANVNGSGIYLSDLKEYAKPYIDMGKIKNDNEGLNKILEVMIDEELIFQICEDNGIEINNEYIEEVIDNIKTQLKSENTELVKKYLNVPTDFILKRRIKIDTGMLSMIRKLYRGEELTFYVKMPTDSDIIKYYEDNSHLYKSQEERQIKHILITYTDDEEDKQRAVELINNIKNAIKSGRVDFEEMASKYSQDYTTKDEGGNLGYFRKYQLKEFSTEYEKYAFSLSENNISPIINISNAYAILMVSDIRQAEEISLPEVSDDIYLTLLEKNFYDAFGPYFDKYKKDSYIEIQL